MCKFRSSCSPLYFSLFLSSLLQLIIPGLSADNEAKVASHSKSKGSVAVTVFLVILGLVVAVALAVFLFRMWQKKKREEQQARLLKLFEQDDDLEDELGLRD